MKLTGRVINAGNVSGEAFVLDMMFSFVGDFDPQTGMLSVDGHPLNNQSMAGKILICQAGKGGTIAPFIAYQAMENKLAPAAILCRKVEPIICESALAINIPILYEFDKDPVATIKSGWKIIIQETVVTVESK